MDAIDYNKIWNQNPILWYCKQYKICFVCLFKTIPVAAYNTENTAKTLVVVRENCTVEEANAELDNQSEGV